MAKKFLSPLNLLNLTADPGTATEGDFYWNSSTNKLRIYFDGAWADASSSGAGSGDVVGPASSINNNIVLFDGTTGKLVKDGGKGLPSGTILGTTDTQTLTNKTLGDSTTYFQNQVDNTKKLQFDLSAITPSTTISLTVPNSTGTIALRSDVHYIGTTSIALNRSSASQTLTGISIDGNSGTVTDGFYTTSSFYLGTTSIPVNRISAVQSLTGISIDGNAGTVTNGVYTTGTYSNPSWITGLAWSKISSTPTTLSGYGITDAQPLDADLTAIAALTGTSGFLKKTAADTWTLDTSTYLTGNQTITLSGDITGSGTTAITTTLANSGATAGTYKSVTVDVKGRVTSGTNPTTLSGYGITDAIDTSATAQTKSGNLTAAQFIKSGGTSSEFLKADGSSDSSTYLTTSSASSTYAPIASPTFTGTVTLPGAPTSALHAATKQYVDDVAAGINFHAAVKYATTGALGTTGNLVGGTITTTYDNGTSGVGATLTIATSSNWTAITIDGQSLTAGDRILIKDQVAGLQNGIYTVTTLGAIGNTTSFVFTRATDADNSPSGGELAPGDFTFVQNGTLNGGFGYINNSASAITIGTTAVSYTIFNTGQSVIAGDGLQELTPGALSVNSTVIRTSTTSLPNVTSVNSTTIPNSKTLVVTTDIGTSVQAYDADLAAIAALTGTSGNLIKTGTNTWALDGTSYLSTSTASSTYAALSSANTFTNNQLISVNTSGNALEIRQIGAGNAFVVEDSANPDSTPFIIDASGNVGIGKSPSVALDVNGQIRSTDSTVDTRLLSINSSSAGQIGTYSNHPLSIATNSTERMRIDASGNTTINTIANGTTSTAASGGGYMGMPQVSTATGITLDATHAGKHIYVTATGQTITIPAATVTAFPIGTTIVIINAPSVSTSIAINTDTLRLANSASTGTRTLASNGMCTLVKISGVSSTGIWIASGNGLT